jgi:ASC-1-like (ASCH) protein
LIQNNNKKELLAACEFIEFKGKNTQLQVVSVKIYDIFVRCMKSNSRVVSERIFLHCCVVKLRYSKEMAAGAVVIECL